MDFEFGLLEVRAANGDHTQGCSYLKKFKRVPSWHAKWTRRSTCPKVNGGVCAKWQGHKGSCSSEWKEREKYNEWVACKGIG